RHRDFLMIVLAPDREDNGLGPQQYLQLDTNHLPATRCNCPLPRSRPCQSENRTDREGPRDMPSPIAQSSFGVLDYALSNFYPERCISRHNLAIRGDATDENVVQLCQPELDTVVLVRRSHLLSDSSNQLFMRITPAGDVDGFGFFNEGFDIPLTRRYAQAVSN